MPSFQKKKVEGSCFFSSSSSSRGDVCLGTTRRKSPLSSLRGGNLVSSKLHVARFCLLSPELRHYGWHYFAFSLFLLPMLLWIGIPGNYLSFTGTPFHWWNDAKSIYILADRICCDRWQMRPTWPLDSPSAPEHSAHWRWAWRIPLCDSSRRDIREPLPPSPKALETRSKEARPLCNCNIQIQFTTDDDTIPRELICQMHFF